MELQNALVEIAVRQIESVTGKSVRETELETEEKKKKKEGVGERSKVPQPVMSTSSDLARSCTLDPHKK